MCLYNSFVMLTIITQYALLLSTLRVSTLPSSYCVNVVILTPLCWVCVSTDCLYTLQLLSGTAIQDVGYANYANLIIIVGETLVRFPLQLPNWIFVTLRNTNTIDGRKLTSKGGGAL